MADRYQQLAMAMLSPQFAMQQAQTSADLQRAQRDQELAAMFMQQPYQQGSGMLGAMNMLLGSLAGRRLDRQAGERFSDALSRQFALDQQRAQAAYAQQLAAEEQKYDRQLQQATEVARIRNQGRDNRTTRQKDAEAMGLKPGTPQYNEFIRTGGRVEAPRDPTFAEWQSWTPEQRQAYGEFKGRGGDGLIVETLPDGTTRVIQGGKGGLTTPVKTDLQKDVLGAEEALSNLDSIAENFSSDYLTYVGRARAAVGGVLDKAGIESDETKFNANRSAFVSDLNQFFNAYRKEITGAAAGEKELERLMQAMMNMNQGPQAFRATYNEFREKIARNMALKSQQAGRGGLPSLIPGAAPAGNTQRPRSSGGTISPGGAGWGAQFDPNG